MSIKKSLYLSDLTENWITATSGGDEDPAWSASVNATFEQFRYLLGQALPNLSRKEWTALLNIYAGWRAPCYSLPIRIASDIMDDAGTVDISRLPDDTRALVHKMHGLSQLEQLAVLYFVQIFWSTDRCGQAWDEIVADICAQFGL